MYVSPCLPLPPHPLSYLSFSPDSWCKNCKKMVPAIERLASGPLGEKLKVLTVDIDEAGDLADEYDVSGVPSFVALRGGSGDKADEYKGSDPAVLEAKISALLE